MALKHKKTNSVPAWTQTDLDAAIAAGTVPAGTTLTGFVLSTDWNDTHTIDISGLLKGSGGDIVAAIPGTDYQGPGNYITALTGDVSASGPGSATSTLAAVNTNVGSYGSASQVATFTVNAKGLTTAAGNVTITPAAIGAPAGSGTSTGTNTGDQVVPVNTTATANQFLTAYNNTTGAFTKAQPSSSNLSDVATLATLTGAQALTNKNLTGAGNTFPTFNQNTTGQAGTVATINGLVIAGANVTISGAGTSASPYVVNGSAGSSPSITPYAEVPSGLVNGTNTVFTLANTPANGAGVIVILDGVVQYNGVDYTLSGPTITFATAPATGTTPFAYYNTATATVSGGYPYVEVTGTSMTMVPNTYYYSNNAAQVTLTLPASFSQNDIFGIIGKGAGGWKVAQQAGQVIHLTSTNTTTGTSGSVASGSRYDTMVLRGLVTNTELSATARNGALVIV